ncbi:hypothetical protein PaecuDRAFT_3704 [Paenibacillus curdlanolyticus YK9]|uniref:Uncharacterized protein n=1 Tax=Paenibacillus curdlanolyticus YK9 TaxID=717606 RepID=E0IDK0_9BACL|nr:hypothetical protein PaecuDRAFT_3704 [Paenibacillus curdlanolyticus YK9]
MNEKATENLANAAEEADAMPANAAIGMMAVTVGGKDVWLPKPFGADVR